MHSSHARPTATASTTSLRKVARLDECALGDRYDLQVVRLWLPPTHAAGDLYACAAWLKAARQLLRKGLRLLEFHRHFFAREPGSWDGEWCFLRGLGLAFSKAAFAVASSRRRLSLSRRASSLSISAAVFCP